MRKRRDGCHGGGARGGSGFLCAARLGLAEGDGAMMLGHIQVYVSPLLVERRPWPRSPGRARRRARLGHRQHTKEVPRRTALVAGDAIYVHPAMYEAIKAKLSMRESNR